MKEFDFTNKKILLIGGTSKITHELLLLLKPFGCKLFVSSKELMFSLDHIESIRCDLLLDSDRDLLISLIKKEAFDVIINLAGVGLYGSFMSHTSRELVNLLKINLESCIVIATESARFFVKENKEAIILTISSAADAVCYPYFSIYSASKAALTNALKAFDEEIKETKVRILTFSPGVIATDFQMHASKGRLTKTPSKSISAKEAAEKILYQIQKRKRYLVYPFSVKLLRCIAKLIPENLRFKLLIQGMKSRLKKD
jgi:short-subunit dehydrogenase